MFGRKVPLDIIYGDPTTVAVMPPCMVQYSLNSSYTAVIKRVLRHGIDNGVGIQQEDSGQFSKVKV